MIRNTPLFFIALLIFMGLPNVYGEPRIYDEYGFTYTSLEEAVANASEGATVYVEGGLHIGNIVIERSIHLVGIDYPVVDAGYRGSVFEIRGASNVTIEGFKIIRSGRVYSTEDSGIKIDSSSYIVIRNNVLDDVFFGLLIKNSSDIEVLNNSITGIPDYYLSDRMHGIYNWYSRRISIIGNNFSYTKDGVYNDHNYETVIIGNSFYDGRYGVHLMYSDHYYIANNTITGFVAGMALMYSENVTVRYNYIVNNRVGGIGEGLFIPETDDLLVEYNWIVGNVVGINIRYTPYTPGRYSIIRYNVIAFNYIGLNVDTDSEAYVYGNDFIENIQNIRYIGYTESRITWYNETLKLGNYWSGYVGYDSDMDGILDIPYISIDPLYRFFQEHRELLVYYFSPTYEILNIVFKYSFESRLEGLIEDPYPQTEPINIKRLDLKVYLENLPYAVLLTSLPIYVFWRGVGGARGRRG